MDFAFKLNKSRNNVDHLIPNLNMIIISLH